MLSKISEHVADKHPMLFIFIGCLFIAGFLYMHSNFALADDVKEDVQGIKGELSGLKSLVSDRFDRQEIRAIRQEIRKLEDLIKKGEARESDTKALVDLKSDMDEIQDRLSK